MESIEDLGCSPFRPTQLLGSFGLSFGANPTTSLLPTRNTILRSRQDYQHAPRLEQPNRTQAITVHSGARCQAEMGHCSWPHGRGLDQKSLSVCQYVCARTSTYTRTFILSDQR